MTKAKLGCLARWLFAVILVAQSSRSALAAPLITGTSGSAMADQFLTISGSAFGTKSRQQALMFDSISSISGYQSYLQHNTIVPTKGCAFGSGSCEINPQPVCASCPWYNHWYGGTPRFYIGSHSRYPGHPAYRAMSLASDTRKGYFARDFALNTSQGWTTLDWWIRANSDFGYLVSGKILRFWHNPDVVDQIVVVDNGGPNELFMDMTNCGYAAPSISYLQDWPLNQWFHLQIQTHVSPSENKTWLLMDGVLVASTTTVCGNDGIYDYLRMVGYDPSVPENLDLGMEFLWGDISFDDSLARVLISDSQSYAPQGNASPVHYETQNVQSWSDNSISVKFNPGSFTSGQTVYLYVVDGNGAINSAGHPIVVGSAGSGDTIAPQSPTGLRLSGE